ncbi:MAG: TIM barrel protein [Clostridia bacterium]|nr:TIM barrel protein [Clostridia bacterium]
MKLAVLCDMHMGSVHSPQYAFFQYFANKMEEDNIPCILCLGDITAYGEKEVFDAYVKEMSRFNHHYVIGNSDVRSEKTQAAFLGEATGFDISLDGIRILGINTPFGKIEEKDRPAILGMQDGEVLAMHHSIHMLDEDSRAFITKVAEEKALTILHGHSHKTFDFVLGKSRVLGFRAADPDKSIGDYPCVTYVEMTKDGVSYEEVLRKAPQSVLKDIEGHFGISCVDNHRDVAYALEKNVYGVELRCNGAGWEPDDTLIPLIDAWREKTHGYLSVHMPNLRFRDGEITGKDTWYQAVDYAKKVGADGLTIHPPRVKKPDMQQGGKAWQEFLQLYLYAVEAMPERVKVGIENLHMEADETDDDKRGFGYCPDEVLSWIAAINDHFGRERVGHTLDVGHARNNGPLAQKFPCSRWYELMGSKTVAYHIHQIVPNEYGLSNHNAIEQWLAPVISYAAFFYSWEANIINHCPVFLEVRGCENYQKSIDAFQLLLD